MYIAESVGQQAHGRIRIAMRIPQKRYAIGINALDTPMKIIQGESDGRNETNRRTDKDAG